MCIVLTAATITYKKLITCFTIFQFFLSGSLTHCNYEVYNTKNAYFDISSSYGPSWFYSPNVKNNWRKLMYFLWVGHNLEHDIRVGSTYDHIIFLKDWFCWEYLIKGIEGPYCVLKKLRGKSYQEENVDSWVRTFNVYCLIFLGVLDHFWGFPLEF